MTFPDAADVRALMCAEHPDPFAVLGPHRTPAGWVLRVLRPDAWGVTVLDANTAQLATLVQLAKHQGFDAHCSPFAATSRRRIQSCTRRRPKGVSQ